MRIHLVPSLGLKLAVLCLLLSPAVPSLSASARQSPPSWSVAETFATVLRDGELSRRGNDWWKQRSVLIESVTNTIQVSESTAPGQLWRVILNYLRKERRDWLVLFALGLVLLSVALFVPVPPMLESLGELRITVPRSTVRKALTALTGLSIVFAAGTAVFTSYYRGYRSVWEDAGWLKHVLIQFNLTTENVLAVWFSSAILLISGLSAIAAGWTYRGRRESFVRIFWTLLGIGFVALSADEIGSLHEKVLLLLAELRDSSGLARTSRDLVVFVVGLFALPFVAAVWIRARHSPKALVLFAAGVLLLLSIPIHERIEMAAFDSASDPSQWLRPIWQMVFEEGSELAGGLCFLASFLFLVSDSTTEHPAAIPRDRSTWRFAWSLLALLAFSGSMIVFARIVFEKMIVRDDIGRLSQWFAAAPALKEWGSTSTTIPLACDLVGRLDSASWWQPSVLGRYHRGNG